MLLNFYLLLEHIQVLMEFVLDNKMFWLKHIYRFFQNAMGSGKVVKTAGQFVLFGAFTAETYTIYNKSGERSEQRGQKELEQPVENAPA